MKKLKLIALAILLAVGPSKMCAAEAGGIKINPNTWWRITSGKGAGVSLQGVGNIIIDPFWGANGHIGSGTECDCRHYHGILFELPDPNEPACGWGCAENMPYTSDAALAELRNEVSLIGIINPMLGAKLDDLLDGMDNAAATGCYSAVEALADAIEDEIYAYFGEDGDSSAFDNFFGALTEFVNLTEYELPLGYINMPLVKPMTVRLLRRVGSGDLSRLFDVGMKINTRIGSLISLEGYGQDVDLYKWEYKWKGAAVGENPSGCFLSYVGNHMTAMSQKATQVRVTLSGRGPDNRYFRDMTVINFSKLNF